MGITAYHHSIPKKRLKGVNYTLYYEGILGNVFEECHRSAMEGTAVHYQTLLNAHDIDDEMLQEREGWLGR